MVGYGPVRASPTPAGPGPRPGTTRRSGTAPRLDVAPPPDAAPPTCTAPGEGWRERQAPGPPATRTTVRGRPTSPHDGGRPHPRSPPQLRGWVVRGFLRN